MVLPFTEMGKSMRETDLRGKVRRQSIHVNFNRTITYPSAVQRWVVEFINLEFWGEVRVG